MIEIKYSPANKGQFDPVFYPKPPAGGISNWIMNKSKYANQMLVDNMALPFNAVVFAKSDLKLILDQEFITKCTQIVLSSIVIKDNTGIEYSTLLATGEDDVNAPFDLVEDHKFIGIPINIDFGLKGVSDITLHEGKKVAGYTWNIGKPTENKIQDWLVGRTKHSAFVKSIDMLTKVKFHIDDCGYWFDASRDSEDWIVFFPAVYYCSVDIIEGEQPDVSGNYCTLMACGLPVSGIPDPNKNEYRFLVSRNAWRPNWPVGGGGKRLSESIEVLIQMLKEINPLLEKLNESQVEGTT